MNAVVVPIRSVTMTHGGAWVGEMRARNFTDRTITTWTEDVCRCSKWCGVPAEQLSRDDIVAYLGQEHFSAGTRAAYFSGLHAWTSWLHETGRRDDDPMAGLHSPRRRRGVPHPVPESEVRRLLAATLTINSRAMILLAAYAGLRVSEIAKFRGDDISCDELHVVGKGGKDCWLPTHPLVWTHAQIMPLQGWWFPSPTRPGCPINGKSVSIRLSEVMHRNGVQGSAHWLRHSFGTRLLAGGADLLTVAQLMRHESVATTQIYIQVADGSARDAIMRLAA